MSVFGSGGAKIQKSESESEKCFYSAQVVEHTRKVIEEGSLTERVGALGSRITDVVTVVASTRRILGSTRRVNLVGLDEKVTNKQLEQCLKITKLTRSLGWG